MPQICPLPQTQEEIDSYIVERLTAVKTAFLDVFGILDNPGVIGINLLNNSIQTKQNELDNLRDELSVAKANRDLLLLVMLKTK